MKYEYKSNYDTVEKSEIDFDVKVKAGWEPTGFECCKDGYGDAMVIQRFRRPLDQSKEDFEKMLNEKSEKECAEKCVNIARGCHDYNGGHNKKQDNEIYHHGIQTVINCLEKFQKNGLKDFQLAVVHSIGESNNPNEKVWHDETEFPRKEKENDLASIEVVAISNSYVYVGLYNYKEKKWELFLNGGIRKNINKFKWAYPPK